MQDVAGSFIYGAGHRKALVTVRLLAFICCKRDLVPEVAKFASGSIWRSPLKRIDVN